MEYDFSSEVINFDFAAFGVDLDGCYDDNVGDAE